MAHFVLFPIDTVIFEEHLLSVNRAGNGWWNRAIDEGLPLLYLERTREKLSRRCDGFLSQPRTGTPSLDWSHHLPARDDEKESLQKG